MFRTELFRDIFHVCTFVLLRNLSSGTLLQPSWPHPLPLRSCFLEFIEDRLPSFRRSLREFPNGDCVFFDTEKKGCQVYGARPVQCSTWPFWDSNLKSQQAWKATCEECPGSGTGKVYSLEEIEGQRKQMRI